MATHTRSTSGVAVIGIDIGKDIFHLLGFDDAGSVVLRRKIKRLALVQTFEALPRCVTTKQTQAMPQT